MRWTIVLALGFVVGLGLGVWLLNDRHASRAHAPDREAPSRQTDARRSVSPLVAAIRQGAEEGERGVDRGDRDATGPRSLDAVALEDPVVMQTFRHLLGWAFDDVAGEDFARCATQLSRDVSCWYRFEIEIEGPAVRLQRASPLQCWEVGEHNERIALDRVAAQPLTDCVTRAAGKLRETGAPAELTALVPRYRGPLEMRLELTAPRTAGSGARSE
jgi:hypothetical protein